MKPTCQHWQHNPSIIGGGVCRQGQFGGRPNFAACAVCPHWSGAGQEAYRQHWQVAVAQLHPGSAAALQPEKCGGCGQ